MVEYYKVANNFGKCWIQESCNQMVGFKKDVNVHTAHWCGFLLHKSDLCTAVHQ